jgi:stage V sporulation protein AD
LLRFLRTSQTSPEDYDVIVTGDLGYEGGSILCELMEMEGYNISKQYQDCGQMIFTKQTQDTHAGGSGCGCSAVVMASYFLPKLLRGEIKNMIFMGTGAMMSPTSIQQGMAIPGIAHLLVLESPCRVKKGIG